LSVNFPETGSHVTAHAPVFLFSSGVNEPVFVFIPLNPNLKVGTGFFILKIESHGKIYRPVPVQIPSLLLAFFKISTSLQTGDQ